MNLNIFHYLDVMTADECKSFGWTQTVINIYFIAENDDFRCTFDCFQQGQYAITLFVTTNDKWRYKFEVFLILRKTRITSKTYITRNQFFFHVYKLFAVMILINNVNYFCDILLNKVSSFGFF